MNSARIKSISAIFPCYNEKKNIIKQISDANFFLSGITDDYEIIVVNDGSTDGSRILLERMACENKKIKIISNKSNLGYGEALYQGFRQSTKELVFYTSMDNQYDISQISSFIPHIAHNDVIIGYRVKRKDPLYRILISRLYNLFVYTLYGLKAYDINCAFKLFKRSCIFRIKVRSHHFFVDAEILLRLIKLDYTIKQLGVQQFSRTIGSSTINLKRVCLTLFEMIKLWKEVRL